MPVTDQRVGTLEGALPNFIGCAKSVTGGGDVTITVMHDAARLLETLERMTYDGHTVQRIIDDFAPRLPEHERRGTNERVALLRRVAQELFDWASDVRLDEPRN